MPAANPSRSTESGSEEREEIPRHVFLDPARRRYPVKVLRGGKWVYNYRSLRAAISRANSQGDVAIQRRASRILDEEFGEGDGQGGRTER